jgi:type III secretion protein C
MPIVRKSLMRRVLGGLRHPLEACLLAAGLLVAGAFGDAQAAPLPQGDRQVSLVAREQPVGAFLQDLFAQIDVPASLSPNLAGAVNGSFRSSASKVLRDIGRIYNLVTYFDGSVMHVVPANEVVTRTYGVTQAMSERMIRAASELNLMDSRNTLRASGDGNVVATGTRRFVEQIDELVRAGKAQQQAVAQPIPAAQAQPVITGGADFRVFYLRYAWAQDVTVAFGGRQVTLPGVVSILRSLVEPGAASATVLEQQIRPTLPGLRGQGLISQGVSPKAVRGARGTAPLVDALASNAQPAAEEGPAYAAPVGALVSHGTVRIEADPRLNAVIVRDRPERLPSYERLIAALDVEPQSLEIEATIIDVNTDKLRELGINWRWNTGRSSVLVGNGTTSDERLQPGQVITPSARGGVVSAVLGSASQFLSRISALQAEGAARVVSSPQVVTLSNVEALFDNTSTFYIKVAGKDEVDLFNVSAGTSLRVTPHVFRDQDATRIKLMVQIEDGAITARSVDGIPVVDRSTINTQALIGESESLLIGGLVRDSVSTNVDKVPGLGDVPVVGNLFKTTSNGASRIERMFLISPRLASSRPNAGAQAAAQRRAPVAAAAPAVVLQAAPAAPVPPVAVGVRAPADRDY